MSYLFFPQVILTLWAPLLVWLLAWATHRWRASLTPRHGFWVSLGLLLLPVLMWWVPYLPDLPLRELLPYRVPIAWGIYNSPQEFTGLQRQALTLPAMVALGSMVWAALYGVAEELAAYWRISRLPHQREGQVRVLDIAGDAAFTLGLLRPHIYISRHVWEGPHRAAILAHEQAHTQEKHGFWLALARWSRRTLWYWPWADKLLREVQTWTELVADEKAAEVVGKPALARALKAAAPIQTPSPALTFTATETFERRVIHLFQAGKPLSPLACFGLMLMFLALLILV